MRLESDLFECILYAVAKKSEEEVVKRLELFIDESCFESRFIEVERQYTTGKMDFTVDIYRLQTMFVWPLERSGVRMLEEINQTRVQNNLVLYGKHMKDTPHNVAVRNFFCRNISEVSGKPGMKPDQLATFLDKAHSFVKERIKLKPVSGSNIYKCGRKIITRQGLIISIFRLLNNEQFKKFTSNLKEVKTASELPKAASTCIVDDGLVMITVEQICETSGKIGATCEAVKSFATLLESVCQEVPLETIQAMKKK